ncbi:MAG TPA: enolase C-terminal domain-like protein [Thermomicrobiales bacterium]|nr:enolase C-terminal domain-like protein [Thermomicrobiales bacterium]
MPGNVAAPVERVTVSAYTIPTDRPEADGTFAWDETTMVLVETDGGGQHGIGFTYADPATANLIERSLAPLVTGMESGNIAACWAAMIHAIRNLGRPGIASMAIAAVDVALWDLKAKRFAVPLFRLLSAERTAVPVYGSGGFTSYPLDVLQAQLAGWVEQGIPRVKMKIGTHPEDDLARVRAARQAIGPDAELFVDANGAYSRKQALVFAERFAELDVSWFEEPVSSDDLAGLHLLRDRAPAGMNIAAGEYGYDSFYFRRMLDAGAVDVLQADASRCAGITGFLRVADLCDAHGLPFSAHTAPSLHVHACCAAPRLIHLEYFHDHARIEHMLFDGALDPVDGALHPDSTRPGLGLEFKRQDAEQWTVSF